jgi:antitoxin component YwqK of YwqJK toxin-antitoxin module
MADGLFAKWYENGEKESEETFKDGEKDGLWTYWHDNRKKKRELTFKDGKEDGLFTEWYWIGRKKEEGTYKDGNQDGGWTYYTDFVNGKYEVRYTTGNIDSATFTDNLGQTYSGILIQDYDEATRVDGQYLYQSWAYDFSIYPEIFATIKNGKKDGLWAQWSQDGEKTIELVYKDDKKWNGKWTEWYSNGQKRIEGTYKDGIKTGYWLSWDSLGVFHSASDWFDKGYNAYDNKEYDKAISFYLRAIELDPDNAGSYNNLGVAYKAQGNITKAIPLYEKSIELDPDNATAYTNLGIVYYNSNFDKALIYYKKAARLGHKRAQDWLKKNGYEW